MVHSIETQGNAARESADNGSDLKSVAFRNEGVHIEPALWVEHLTGLSERQLKVQIDSREPLDIKSGWLKKAGEFSTHMVGDLRQSFAGRSGVPTARFTIYVRGEQSNNEFFDTSAMQLSLRSEKPVLFQVASNFNCLENRSVEATVFDGNYLGGLMTDRTQGPCAAAGAGAGAIVRLQRHRHDPINLLDQTECMVLNGKLVALDNQLRADKVAVGLQSGVQANFNRMAGCVYFEEGTLIDQVFVSTLCVTTRQELARFSRGISSLLQAAYEGTYLAANRQNSERMVLTLVGGGSFNNPLDQISNALVQAHIEYGGGLKEVILPLFDPRIDPRIFAGKLLRAGYPSELIRFEIK